MEHWLFGVHKTLFLSLYGLWYSQISFVRTPINGNPRYATQDCQKCISPNVFHPFNPETSLSVSDTKI